MKIYNYSEARQNFATILNTSQKEEVIIARKDGSKFKIVPILDEEPKSPFDVKGINSNIKTKEIIDIVRNLRERS